jgi:uncharacterized membrane protein YeiH
MTKILSTTAIALWQARLNPGALLLPLDVFGLAVASVSGTLAARRKNLDLFGVPVVAVVTCFGGGTLRDLLLDRKPLLWLARPWLLLMVIAVAALTLVYAHFRAVPERSLLVADAIALGYFALVGTKITLLSGAPPLAAVLLGTMSGVAGGALRDMLCADVPLIFGGQIYALAALTGAGAFVWLRAVHVNPTVALLAGVVITTGVRLAAIFWDLKVPGSVFTRRNEDAQGPGAGNAETEAA